MENLAGKTVLYVEGCGSNETKSVLRQISGLKNLIQNMTMKEITVMSIHSSCAQGEKNKTCTHLHYMPSVKRQTSKVSS